MLPLQPDGTITCRLQFCHQGNIRCGSTL